MTSRQSAQYQAIIAPIWEYFGRYAADQQRVGASGCDFAFGTPHDMPIPQLGEGLRACATPQTADWFAYKMSEEASQRHVAEVLRWHYQVPFAPEDVCMTNGAAGALSLALTTLLDSGDEVIINLPPWFFYEGYIAAAYGVAVKVPIRADTFDLDLAAIAAAITPRTRAIIVNSPNNPTGKIYPAETLRRLAAILAEAGERGGRPIYLISDEAYSRLLFDGREFMTPTAFYPSSLLVYTYGKTLLTPGQRLGYLALSPAMPGREALCQSLAVTQVLQGWAFPSALMQYAMPDLEQLCIDLADLQGKRDWLVRELRAIGYEVTVPAGTFYLLARSPIPDDITFTSLLAEHAILCLPGSVAEIPGYFRISLTASRAMIARALPGFARALARATSIVAWTADRSAHTG